MTPFFFQCFDTSRIGFLMFDKCIKTIEIENLVIVSWFWSGDVTPGIELVGVFFNDLSMI